MRSQPSFPLKVNLWRGDREFVIFRSCISKRLGELSVTAWSGVGTRSGLKRHGAAGFKFLHVSLESGRLDVFASVSRSLSSNLGYSPQCGVCQVLSRHWIPFEPTTTRTELYSRGVHCGILISDTDQNDHFEISPPQR